MKKLIIGLLILMTIPLITYKITIATLSNTNEISNDIRVMVSKDTSKIDYSEDIKEELNIKYKEMNIKNVTIKLNKSTNYYSIDYTYAYLFLPYVNFKSNVQIRIEN